jgi:hypothetical protein
MLAVLLFSVTECFKRRSFPFFVVDAFWIFVLKISISIALANARVEPPAELIVLAGVLPTQLYFSEEHYSL